jgi:hypothetical protein
VAKSKALTQRAQRFAKDAEEKSFTIKERKG